MTQIQIDIYEGAVVVQHGGQKRVLDRFETGGFTINLEDDPNAQKPDESRWTDFAEAIPHRQGQQVELPDGVKVFRNNRYTVERTELASGAFMLSIKANDRSWLRDWRHLQRIKNEICGPEYEAAELFPAESRLLDEANQFWLWVLPEGEQFQFGFTADEVEVRDEAYGEWEHGAKQRPRRPDERSGVARIYALAGREPDAMGVVGASAAGDVSPEAVGAMRDLLHGDFNKGEPDRWLVRRIEVIGDGE